MSRDDIIRMAREAGLCMANDEWPLMERFAALVAAAEREAMVAIVIDNAWNDSVCFKDDLLSAIRARSKQ